MNKVARYGGIKYNNNITKQPGYIYTSNTGMVIVNELYQVKQFYDVNHLPQSVVYIAGDGINITSNVITVKNDIARKSDLTSKADLIGGKVPSTQLPSYVDDVIQGYIDLANNKFYGDVNKQNEITAESGKIYIDLTSNLQYRFGGSVFVSISKSLALGQTAQTAFAGDRGKVIEQEMEGKLNKEEGKGLSTNDYTTEQKTKLSGIETNAEVNIIESITINGSTPTVSNKNQTFNIKSCSPIPSSVNTYGTTVQFCNDMINANKGNAQVGMMYMGTVHLKDVPLDM